MYIIFSLGCRSEECGGLRWCDVNFEDYEVNYNYAVISYVSKHFLNDKKRVRVKELKTDNSYRTNYLSDKTISLLKNYYTFQQASGIIIKDDDLIFKTWDGESIVEPRKLSLEWKRFRQKYKIKNVELHRICHTIANLLEKHGVSKKDIAKLLWNTERVLEEFYTYVDSDELKHMSSIIQDKIYNDVNTISLNIDLVVKVLNKYPMNLLSKSDLNMLDYLLNDTINNFNYEKSINNIRDQILSTDPKLIYFIDEDAKRLETKVESYKLFTNNTINIVKAKDLVISKDIFSI